MAHSALGVILRPDQNLTEMLAPFLYYEPDDETGFKYMVEEDIEDELRRTYEYRKKENESFDDYVQRAHYGIKKSPQTGRYCIMKNPNCEMDSWVLGGRWSGKLKLRDVRQKHEISSDLTCGGARQMLAVEQLLTGAIGDNCEYGWASCARIGDVVTEQDEATVAFYKRLWGLMAGEIEITDADMEKWPGIGSDESIRDIIGQYWGSEDNFVLMQKLNWLPCLITPDGEWHRADGALARTENEGWVDVFGTSCCCKWKTPIQKKDFFVPENIIAIVDYHF